MHRVRNARCIPLEEQVQIAQNPKDNRIQPKEVQQVQNGNGKIVEIRELQQVNIFKLFEWIFYIVEKTSLCVAYIFLTIGLFGNCTLLDFFIVLVVLARYSGEVIELFSYIH